jgi:G3E family GTPase
MAVPVHIVAGFLGAGKTTLMNRVLAGLPDDCKAALVVNDFGDVALDGALIDRGGYALRELASGCVCCTLKGPLLETLQYLVEEESPDLILMETTGVAEPAEIASSLRSGRLANSLVLGNIVCLVDAASFLRYEKGLIILGKQVAQANTILINKTDLVDAKVLSAVQDRVDFLRTPDAAVFEVKAAAVDASTVLETRPMALPHTHGHQHDEEFLSFSVETEKVVDMGRLQRYLDALGGPVLRAKGIVRTDEGTRLVQWTPSGCDITKWTGETVTSRFVCIGRGMETESLEVGFRKCLS